MIAVQWYRMASILHRVIMIIFFVFSSIDLKFIVGLGNRQWSCSDGYQSVSQYIYYFFMQHNVSLGFLGCSDKLNITDRPISLDYMPMLYICQTQTKQYDTQFMAYSNYDRDGCVVPVARQSPLNRWRLRREQRQWQCGRQCRFLLSQRPHFRQFSHTYKNNVDIPIIETNNNSCSPSFALASTAKYYVIGKCGSCDPMPGVGYDREVAGGGGATAIAWT